MVRMVAQKAWINHEHEGAVDVGHSFEASDARAAELQRGGLAFPALPQAETIAVAANPPVDGSPPPVATPRAGRRALLQFGIGAEAHRMLDISGPAHDRFAERWGAERITIREPKVKGRPPRSYLWRKVALLIETLRRFDQVLYLDADAVIVDPAEDIFLLARRGIAMCECWGSPDQPVHLQAGVMLFNRSAEVLAFLDRWGEMPAEGASVTALMKDRRWRDLLTIIPNRYNNVAGRMDAIEPVILAFRDDAERIAHMTAAIAEAFRI